MSKSSIACGPPGETPWGGVLSQSLYTGPLSTKSQHTPSIYEGISQCTLLLAQRDGVSRFLFGFSRHLSGAETFSPLYNYTYIILLISLQLNFAWGLFLNYFFVILNEFVKPGDVIIMGSLESGVNSLVE